MKKENPWKHENLFYQLSNPSRLRKIIDHYEIYKMIKNIDGDIYEFGVFKGASFIRFLTFREVFNLKNKIYGFDAFGKFPLQKIKDKHFLRDKAFARHHDKVAGVGIKKNKLKEILKKKKFTNYELIEGDIINSLDKFLSKNKKIKISLLHIDLDIFHPTIYVLEKLYKYVSKNGIIMFDDYGHIKGATLAVDGFLKKNKHIKLSKLSKLSRPSFIIKK